MMLTVSNMGIENQRREVTHPPSAPQGKEGSLHLTGKYKVSDLADFSVLKD